MNNLCIANSFSKYFVTLYIPVESTMSIRCPQATNRGIFRCHAKWKDERGFLPDATEFAIRGLENREQSFPLNKVGLRENPNTNLGIDL